MKTEQTSESAASVADQTNSATEKPASKKAVAKKTGGKKTDTKGAKAKKAPARAKSAPTAGDRTNKKAEVIAMMKRLEGVTLAEIMATTGWQAHTVRGFVSILGSKGGERIESTKNAAGDRTYRIPK